MQACSWAQHASSYDDSKQTGKYEEKFRKKREAQGRGGNEGGRSMNGAKEGDSGSSLLGTAG